MNYFIKIKFFILSLHCYSTTYLLIYYSNFKSPGNYGASLLHFYDIVLTNFPEYFNKYNLKYTDTLSILIHLDGSLFYIISNETQTKFICIKYNYIQLFNHSQPILNHIINISPPPYALKINTTFLYSSYIRNKN